MEPIVTLLSWTHRPIETINAIWGASRNNEPVDLDNPDPDLFQKVIDSQIPVAEMIDFVFLLENVSIAFREQMVRHRIGVKVGERIGADIVPELSDSSWWSQSMRVIDMGKFAIGNQFEMPQSINEHRDPIVRQTFERAMFQAQDAYRFLSELGVPLEDARMVVPLAATHRIVWKLNLSALMHVMGKRGCWILQLGFWGPIIKGMVDELSTRVHPAFRDLIRPPCIKGCFKGCCFELDNERRIQGEDEIPPCPLYLHYHCENAHEAALKTPTERKIKSNWYWNGFQKQWECWNLVAHYRMARMKQDYEKLWQRNVDTGEPINGESDSAR